MSQRPMPNPRRPPAPRPEPPAPAPGGFNFGWMEGLWDRWAPAWDIAVQRMSDQTVRDRDAYIQWKQTKELQQKQMAQDTALQKDQWNASQAANALAQRQAEDARMRATAAEQARIQEIARQAQAKPTLFSLGGDKGAGAVADEYTYGQAGPQGRGGGGSAPAGRVNSSIDMGRLEECRRNPAQIGCPEILNKAMQSGAMSSY